MGFGRGYLFQGISAHRGSTVLRTARTTAADTQVADLSHTPICEYLLSSGRRRRQLRENGALASSRLEHEFQTPRGTS